MKNLLVAICFIALALWLSIALTEARPALAGSAGAIAGNGSKDQNEKYQSLVQELKILREGLEAKQAELARLRHKWMVNKGRTPTKEEIKAFEEKKAKGTVKVEDNPYVNRNPLSTPGRWREAYYAKLAEVNKDEERVKLLQKELDELSTGEQ